MVDPVLIEVLEIEGGKKKKKKAKPAVDDFMTGRYGVILTEQVCICVHS